VTEWSKVHAC